MKNWVGRIVARKGVFKKNVVQAWEGCCKQGQFERLAVAKRKRRIDMRARVCCSVGVPMT